MERKRTEEPLKRSEEEARRLAQEASVIAEIGRIISSSFDIEEVYERFAEEVHKLIPFDRVLVNLVDHQGGTITTAYTAGMEVPGRAKRVVFPIKGTVTEEMIRSYAPVLFNPESVEEVQERFPGLLFAYKAGLRSRLSVLLIARGTVIGSLTLWSKQTKAYGERDITLAQSVASQIAGAIANAQLFQECNRAAEALKESEERYRGIFDNALEGIFQSTPEGRFVSVNPALARIYGWESSQEMIREVPSVWSLYTDHAVCLHHRKLLDDKGVARGLEAEHWRKDRSKFLVSLEIREVRDSSGIKVYYEGLVQDSSEKRELEDQLRQAHKMEAIGTLAGGIAHDFNNILAAMIGFSELARDRIPSDSDAQHYLKRVLDAGLRGRELVRQILAFSRKAEGERSDVRLTSVVKETYELLRSSLPSTIRMPLAITTNEDHVIADPTQLQQVIINLATNAAYAMRDSGGELAISVSSVTFPPDSSFVNPDLKPGTYVKLTVQDTGGGIPEEVRGRIFEPFFTTKGKGQGTGMGLAVVHGVVKGHGGAIAVQSEVGRGSRFDVFLPSAQIRTTSEENSRISTPTGTEQILFVDDEEMLLEMGKAMLEGLGYQVTLAQHASEAWRLFSDQPGRFDLVIVDQTMPDMTGMELAKKMLKVHPKVPIILCTGYSDLVSAEKAKEAGIREFSMKPLAKKELAEVVRRVLDQTKDSSAGKVSTHKAR